MLNTLGYKRSPVRAGVRLVLTLIASLVSATAGAQGTSGIAGVVRDGSGAVLPGVVVEATSPSLIEKIRTATTDGQGIYQLLQLPPGTYAVTFTLPGFSAFRREGLQLTTNFTATVNADLAVGSVEESVTVSGESPIVDVNNIVQQRVITNEALETLPTAKTLQSMAALIPGMNMGAGAHEVGGVIGDRPVGMAIHGSRTEDQHMFFDSMRTNNILINCGGGGGCQSIFFNPLTIQEVTLETANFSLESPTGGININVVPKDGGNTFSGSFLVSGTGGGLQGNNLTDRLREQQVTAVDRIKSMWDVNGSFGGPIAQDRLWFYAAYRNWGNENYVANQYFNATPLAFAYTADPDRQAYDPNTHFSVNTRFAWQVSRRNKLTLTVERQDQDLLYSGVSARVSPEATTHVSSSPNAYLQARWSNVVNTKLLLEAGFSRNTMNWNGAPQSDVGPDVISVRELTTNFTYRAPNSFNGRSPDLSIAGDTYYQTFAATYVTGSHAFKAGSTLLHGRPKTTTQVNGDMTYEFFNGAPRNVVLRTTPLVFEQRLKADLGLYAQDRWKLGRLTLNMGVLYTYLNAYVPEQRMPAGTFVPARVYPKVPSVATYHDVTPRLGAAYDLRGDGKTALKVGLSRYLLGKGANAANLFNPLNTVVNTATRSWDDENKNFVPDCDLLNPDRNIECGPLSNRSFGNPGVVTTTIDPATLHGFGRRNYNWEVNAGIQHELSSRVSANATYFHRWWGNFLINDNRAVTAADYDPYCVVAPLDPHLPGGGGNQICGLYDLNPSKVGAVDNLVTFAKNYGSATNGSDAIDLTINARLPRGAGVQGGTTIQRVTVDMCDVAGKVDAPAATLPFNNGALLDLLSNVSGQASPSTNFCRYAPPFLTDFKISGSYPLPWGGILLSAAIQSLPGPEIAATRVYTNAAIVPSLGRNLSAGPAGTASVQLVEPGTLYGDRLNQVDFRVTKPIRVRRVSIRAMADVYNLFNVSPVLSLNNTYGPTWQQPSRVLPARFVKFGAQLDF